MDIHSYCVEGERFGIRFKRYCIHCKNHIQFAPCKHEKTVMESIECKHFVERESPPPIF